MHKVKKFEGILATVAQSDQNEGMTPAETNSDARTDFLLDVAAQTFLEKGFEATSVGEIASRARASKETYYNKFTNKSELFRAVIRRLMDRFVSDATSALLPRHAPRLALTTFGGLLLERMFSDEGVGLQNIIFMEARRFPEIAGSFYDLGPRRTLAALVGFLDAQAGKGTLRKMDSTVAAGHFMGLLTTDMLMLRSLGLLATPSSEERRTQIDAAVDVFLRAYGCKQ